MKIKRTAGLVLTGLVLVVGLVVLAFGLANRAAKRDRPKIEHRTQKKWASAKDAVKAAIDGKVKKSGKPKRKIKFKSKELFMDMKPQDRKIANAIQDSLDVENFTGVSRAAEQALKCDNPEVRENAIEALSWFGPEALPELTSFLTDADSDVAELAADRWQMALAMLEDDAVRVSTAEAALKTVSSKSALEMVVTEIMSQDDDLKIMQALVDIIDSGNSAGVAVAKEEYENMTGEAWSGIDAAEAWLEENYEPEDGNLK